jgi:ribA/ribD-fused uncharacterized protein
MKRSYAKRNLRLKRKQSKRYLIGGSADNPLPEDAIYFLSSSRTYNFLSNFAICEIKEHPITFESMEQYFMYKKAALFDPSQCQKIMTVPYNESEQDGVKKFGKSIQNLGRTIKNFDEKIWDSVREIIMKNGLRLKFTQNEEFKNKLIATGLKTLYEANPYDRIWGIGFEVYDALLVKNLPKYGKNRLGNLLMEIRNELIQAELENALLKIVDIEDSNEVINIISKEIIAKANVDIKSAAAIAVNDLVEKITTMPKDIITTPEDTITTPKDKIDRTKALTAIRAVLDKVTESLKVKANVASDASTVAANTSRVCDSVAQHLSTIEEGV